MAGFIFKRSEYGQNKNPIYNLKKKPALFNITKIKENPLPDVKPKFTCKLLAFKGA